ncbi:MAG TPA: outer membrane beta-barrel protein [Spirochaetia bacterium]|nr:outer membrane beta-barrel protein [Spirochaetia bacterium]
MRRNTIVLVVLALLAAPLTARALGLQVEARGGAGIALGSTNNANTTGTPQFAADGALVLDLTALSVGPLSIGLSAGAEYSYMNFHSVTSNFFSATTLTSDSTYSYLNIPVAIVGHLKLPAGLGLTLRAGGYAGYFLSGQAKNSYNPQSAFFTNGTVTLDSTNTVQWSYGLHFTAGPDFSIGPGLTFSPSLELNWGLTDITVDKTGNAFKDALSPLTANVGIRYALF